MILSCTNIAMDNNAAIPKIQKSFKLQSHRFAVALRFWGYKYCVILIYLRYFPDALATERVKLTAVVVA